MSRKRTIGSCIFMILALVAGPVSGSEFSEFRDRRIDPVVTETAGGWSADGGDYGFQLDRDGRFLYTLDGQTLSLRFDSIRYSRDVEGTTREWVLIGESDANFTLDAERTWTTALLGGAYEIEAQKARVKHTLRFPDGWKAGLPDAKTALGEIKTATGQVLEYPIEIGWVWAVQDMELNANPDAFDEVKEWRGAGLLGMNGAELARLLPNTINGQTIQTSWLWIGDGIGFVWAHVPLADLPDGAFELDPSLVTLTRSEVLDTYVDSANPATNYEDESELYASGTRRALWKIDCAQPSDTIISASVGLYQTGGAAADRFRVWAYPTFSTGATWASGYTASDTGAGWFDGDDADGWHWIDCTLWASEVGDTTASAGTPSDATVTTWADTGTNVDDDRRFSETSCELPGGTILIWGGAAANHVTIWLPTSETFVDKATLTGDEASVAIARSGGQVYAFGGLGGGTNTVRKIDPGSGSITTVTTIGMGNLMTQMAACPLPSGAILVAQGYNATISASTSAAWIFSPTDNSMNAIAVAPDVDRASTLELGGDGIAYLYGGIDGDGKDFSKFDETTGIWTKLSDGSVARSFHSCYRLPSGNLGFIGGDYTTKSTSHQVYSVTSATWLTRDSLPVAISQCCAQIVGATVAGIPAGCTVFVFGGYNGVSDIYCIQYEGDPDYWTQSRIRRSIEIRRDDGSGSGYFYSNDYGNSSYRPTLRIITASSGEPVVSATDFTSQSNSVTYDDFARLTLQPSSRPDAAQWLNFGGYIGGQFNGEFIGPEVFGWQGYIGPSKYSTYGILDASFPTGTGWISVADTSGNTDIQWSFSSGGGGSSGGLTTDQAAQLERVDTRVDDTLTNIQGRVLVQIENATGQIDDMITAARDHDLGHIASATDQINTWINNEQSAVGTWVASVSPLAEIAAGLFRGDLVSWSMPSGQMQGDTTVCFQSIGISAYPYSGTFAILLQKSNLESEGSRSSVVVGYSDSLASWGGISYATSSQSVMGTIIQYHYASVDIAEASSDGLYTMTCVQNISDLSSWRSDYIGSFIKMDNIVVNTSTLATYTQLRQAVADVIHFASQLAIGDNFFMRAWYATENRSPSDPSVRGKDYDLQYNTGNLIFMENAVRDPNGIWGFNLVASDHIDGVTSSAVIFDTSYELGQSAVADNNYGATAANVTLPATN